MTVLTPFLRQVSEVPDRAALIDADGKTHSFADLDRWSRALAAAYARAGVEPGTRVLVALGMTPRLYATLIALWRLGAVAVFPEPAAGLAGLRHAVEAAGTSMFAGPARLGIAGRLHPRMPRLGRRLPNVGASGAVPIVGADDDHPALITFTSGSTGGPKGILRSHGFLLAQQEALSGLLAGHEGADLISLPMFVLANLGFGSTSVIPAGKLRKPALLSPQKLVEQITRHDITRVLAPPSVCEVLARTTLPDKVTSIVTGGGPVFPGLVKRLGEAAPNARITAVYGSTEAEPIAHVSMTALAGADWSVMRAGGGLLAGQVAPGIRLRLIEDEIVVTGHYVNKGYIDARDDAATKLTLDGEIWHRTGDAGRQDAQGRLWLLGRKGHRVAGHFPFAVEVAALSWPGVRQAALMKVDGSAVLAIAGDEAHRSEWTRNAKAFAGMSLKILPSLPTDKRHNSKIDYPRLQAKL